MERTKDFYLLLLAYALVKIRALEDTDGLENARRLADMFHHIPEALGLEWTEEREGRIHQQMWAKAKVHDFEDLLLRWEASAMRRIKSGR